MLLEEEGFDVLPASSMHEAEAALSREFDAAVLDLGVAGLNIEQFIQRIRELPLHPPVLLCSASTRLYQVARELQCATLPKPFEIGEFVTAVSELVGRD
jgi:DNA-binding response OmpR family regulator